MIDQSTFLFDFTRFSSDRSALLSQINEQLSEGKKPLIICTPNPEQVVQSLSNTSFGNALYAADIRIPDGIGLVLASKILALRSKQAALKERITGGDLVTDILTAPAFDTDALIIGGRNYQGRVLQTSAQKFVVGQSPLLWTIGYSDVREQSLEDDEALKQLLMRLRPSVVFVALGAPYQELWIEKNRELLSAAGVQIAMSVGGAFDMLLGFVPRAPGWMQRSGLEWFYRLVQQPWRWRRQLRLLTFIFLVLRAFVLPRRPLVEKS